MSTDITHFNSPIDVMYIIHKALRAEAARVEQYAHYLGTPEALTAFTQVLHHWASVLEMHAAIEDTSMTPFLPERPVVRENEIEHQRLTALFQNIAALLQAAPSQTSLTPRLQRQVLGQVITLRIEHDDHLESEEDLVLPLVRQRLSEAQQGKIIRQLLCTVGTSRDREISPWILTVLTATEQQALATVMAQWATMPGLAAASCAAAFEERR